MRVSFGEYVLDTDRRQVLRGRRAVPLTPKGFALLALLVGRSPSAVSKSEIQDVLWPDIFVSDTNLFKLVFMVRRAIGAEGHRLRTVHRFGYAFAGELEREREAATPRGGLP